MSLWRAWRTDPSLTHTAVEEVLRTSAVTMHFRRTATRPTAIGTKEIAPGDKVVMWFCSANHDEDGFGDPWRFDLAHDPNDHMAFGRNGPRLCLEAWLARMEARLVYEALMKRVDRLEPGGEDTSLFAGLHTLRAERLAPAAADTVVVVDTHWFTTIEHVVSAHERRKGLFTSDELPRGMQAMPYDMPGDPDLARAFAAAAADRDDAWVTAVDDPHLPVHYPTINLLGFRQGDERWVSLVGALGGAACTAKGTQFGQYESVSGTGQAHVWFDL